MALLVWVHRPVKVQFVLPASTALASFVARSTRTADLLCPICDALLNLRSRNSATLFRSGARDTVFVMSHLRFSPDPFFGLVAPAVDRIRCTRSAFSTR